MNKLVVMLVIVLVSVICQAEDRVFSIAINSGVTTTAITNDTDQRWYLKGLYSVASLTNESVTLNKTTSVGNIPVATVAAGTGTNAITAVSGVVYLSPNEVMVITRSLTNATLKGFISTSGVE